ncbi:ribonuclease T2 [Rhodobacter sp. 24-YEA-8]|uniref:ribonuclease T2 n=1 Tax=Rhodobacter sp. 24-YEA-8 TaxID=1884310 RepID=UPI000894385E|nr:ribonuclease T2 [Rhodobacter sp. 24-YEA-8]
MLRILSLVTLCLLTVFPAKAEGERAGDFDYYVMALSWSAGWCEAEGDARRDPQCDIGRGLTFVLHGLWPQKEKGWPSYCRTVERDPTRSESAAIADVMGGAGYAFYQWKKHGRCSGLAPGDYYAKAREAYEKVEIPPVFARMSKTLKVPAEVIEGAFLEANPGLKPDQVTIICQGGAIREVRICLTKDLAPRRCGEGAIRDCRLKDAVLDAVR